MKHHTNWIHFDRRRLDDAGRLLLSARNEAFGGTAEGDTFSLNDAIRAVESELAQIVSTALMLLHGDELVGYAIATAVDDPTWGKSGWLKPGAFAIRSGYERSLPELYARIGKEWLDLGITAHRAFVFAPGGVLPDMWGQLGFAKQQAYAVLDHNGMVGPAAAGSSTAVVRNAKEGDRAAITTFSRVIASYQASGPCFAPVPQSYLTQLDEGFSELLDDDEAEVMVADDGGELRGVAVLYPVEDAQLLAPAGSVELSVAAVKPEHRGSGVGTLLSRAVFADQRKRGRTCIMTDWRCANPLSSRFWVSMGFATIAYRLERRLDPLNLENP